MAQVHDLTGQRFGRWTVLSRHSNPGQRTKWVVRCACGTTRPVPASDLKGGKSVSCGCGQPDAARRANTRHGDNPGRTPTAEYRAWRNMIARCENTNRPDYERYGAKGIAVCPEWRHNYAAFLAEVGRRPTPTHSIDRIKNDRGYEPGNVRWATKSEQSLNRGKYVYKRNRVAA